MNMSQGSSMIGAAQSRQPFGNPSTNVNAVTRNETNFLPSSIPIKRPRADDDDYDI